MKAKLSSPLCALLGLLLLASCAKEEEAGPQAPILAETFTLADDGPIVRESEAQFTKKTNVMRADFNADGLEDVAILEGEADEKRITIYIRKVLVQSDDTDPVYFNAGGLEKISGGQIIGMMTRRNNQYSDLIVIVTFPDKPNQTVHYRNDGKCFSLVQDPIQHKQEQ